MEKDQKKKKVPELNPDGTLMTEEDRTETKGKTEPKPWAPAPRRDAE